MEISRCHGGAVDITRAHAQELVCACIRGVDVCSSPFSYEALLNVVRTHPLRWLLAWSITVAAACIVGYSAVVSAGLERNSHQYGLVVVLLVAALVCARFPVKFGMSNGQVTLDSVPLLLAAVFLAPSDAVLLCVVETFMLLARQPRLPGWQGPFWVVNAALTGGVALGATAIVADVLVQAAEGGVPLHVALLVAVVLELAFTAFVSVELWLTVPEVLKGYFRTFTTPATSIALSALGLCVLSPYLEEGRPLWPAALVMAGLLATMWGALWIANSQQLEKRRGQHLKESFSRYVPEGVVDDNFDSMQAIELGGEQREITVLFCDIRGFTSWSENKGATEVITELNVLLSELSAAVMDTGGTLDKFTGDGLMAFWGAPLPAADHADRACRAALEMLRRLDVVNERRRAEGHAPFAVGVGVHSGPAVVGNVGHERRLDYTAIGDTVNTSARLEGATKEIGSVLLISRDTVDCLGGEMRDRAMKMGDVSVKGKSKSVEVWALRPLRPELDGVEDTFAA